MPQINPDSMMAVQPDLLSGETVVWAGQPSTQAIFHREDVYLVPFSLLWGGFTLFWESVSSGSSGFTNGTHAPVFFQLWGIPFVLVGQYLIWGRFFYAAWLKRRTHYVVTNRRVIVVQNGWQRRMSSSYIDTLPNLIKEGSSNGVGVLRFEPAQPLWSRGQGWGAWNSMAVGPTPTFIDIEDVDLVYRLVSDLREKSRIAKAS